MTSTIKSKDMVVDTISKSGITLTANSFIDVIIDATKSGYKPIGVVGISKSGGASVYVVPSTFEIDGNNFKTFLRNTTNSSATVNLIIFILYQKA